MALTPVFAALNLQLTLRDTGQSDHYPLGLWSSALSSELVSEFVFRSPQHRSVTGAADTSVNPFRNRLSRSKGGQSVCDRVDP